MSAIFDRRLQWEDAESRSELVHVGDRAGHLHRLCCDFSLAERLFGWRPEVSLKEGITRNVEWARRHGHKQLHVRSDSLLLVQQMRGRFKVKHPGLQPLYAKARLLAHEIGRVTFEHVGREHNEHADRLANAAMDDAARSAKS